MVTEQSLPSACSSGAVGLRGEVRNGQWNLGELLLIIGMRPYHSCSNFTYNALGLPVPENPQDWRGFGTGCRSFAVSPVSEDPAHEGGGLSVSIPLVARARASEKEHQC
jgi:hypothetical protein